MKKHYFLIITSFLFLFTLIPQCYSQTVDEVIDNYAAAIGGEDKLMEIKSIKYTGKFSSDGTDIPLIMYVKRDGKTRRELSYQGMNMIRACDQNTGWVINPFQGNKDAERLPPEEVKDLKKNAEIEGELINYKQKGYKAEFLGKDDFEGSEVYKIKLTDKDGDVTYYYLDVSTYMILKDNSKRKIGEKEIKSERIYGNYQKTNGVMFPMSIEYKDVGTDRTQKVNIDKIEMNVNVDDGIFKMPESKLN